MIPTHQKLLKWCAGPEQIGASGARDPLSSDSGGEHIELLELARRHRVHGMLLHRMGTAGQFSALPELLRNEAETDLRRLRLRSALIESEWDRILGALNRAAIVPVGLKGIVLVGTIYPEPVERQLRDIDLLVSRIELRTAIRGLLALGYRCSHGRRGVRAYLRHHFHIQLHHPNGFTVEVHWNVTRPDDYFQLDPTEILRESTPSVRPSGLRFRVPTLRHLILLIVLQNLQEGFSRLARTVDIDRLLCRSTGPDWDKLLDTAARGRLNGPLALSLQICHAAFQTPIPIGLLARLNVALIPRLHLELFRPLRFLMNQRATTRTSASSLLRLWLLPTGALRRRALLSLIFDRSLDPLNWLWKSQPENARLSTVLKLVAYQGYLYARGLAGYLRRDPDQIRFWAD